MQTIRRAGVRLGAAGVSLILAAAAQAALPVVNFDLRVSGSGGKDVTLANVGDSVQLDLYVTLHDLSGTPSDDWIQSAVGAFRSSVGGLKGDLLGLRPPSPFDVTWDTGFQQDLDGDGDLDVGSNGLSATGYYWFRTGTQQEQPAGGYFVGRTRFTLREAADDTTAVNFTLRSAKPSLLAWWDGTSVGTGNDPAVVSVTYGTPVVIRGDAPAPGTLDYISGTYDTHVSVSRPTAVTPGQSLLLNHGFDVAATGSLTGGDAVIRNDVSGNFGGGVNLGSLSVVDGGTFTQAGGNSRFSEISVGDDASSGTLVITGGALEAQVLASAQGALVQHSSGDATVHNLHIGGTHEISGGATTVLDQMRIESGGTLRVAGGSMELQSGAALVAGSILRIEGGEFHLHGSTNGAGVMDGQIRQSGGVFTAPGGIRFGSHDGIAPSNYVLSGGTFAGSSVGIVSAPGSVGTFTQHGGTMAPTTGIFIFAGGTDHVHYRIQGGEVDTRFISVGERESAASSDITRRDRFTQLAGNVRADELMVGPAGRYEMSGGTLRVRKSFLLKGTLDLTGASVPVTLGDNTFGDFTRGTINGGDNATFYGGAGSLMSFAAGFDPLTQIGSIQTQGLVHVAGQPLDIPAGKSIGGSGTIQGDVTNDGLVAPGSSPGVIAIAGDYSQTENAALSMEIGGVLAEDFDLLQITGTAQLGGLLQVALLDDFVPSAGDDFTILTAAGISGRFANAGDVIEFPGGQFDVIYSPTSVTLTNFSTVPEPGCVMIVALALPMALQRRRASVRQLT